jgi:uncharacterized delta-60 repeat protein
MDDRMVAFDTRTSPPHRRGTAGLFARRASLLVLVVLLFPFALPAPAFAAAGELDTTFGGDGKVTTSFAGGGYANAVAIQSDGKIVAAGGTGTEFAVARYDTDGALDPTFGTDGKVTTGFTGGGSANAVAIQSDGKIVAAGIAGGTSSEEFAVARYDTDGALDPTFGTDGIVTTDLTPAWDEAKAVAIQDNGKIVAVGLGTPGSPWRPRFALARYGSDGTPDTSFGDGGTVLTKFGMGGVARAIVLQPDHKMVVAGTAGGSFAVVRYEPHGSLDTSFGNQGKMVTLLPGDAPGNANAVTIQPDGRIVVAGSYDFFRFALARLRVNGKLDTTFGGDGFVITDVGQGSEQWVSGVVIQSNGRIVAAGTGGPHEYGEAPPAFVLTRYRATGILDTTFGDGDGKVITEFANGATAGGVAAQADGRIVVVGNHAWGSFALARYLV